MRRTGKIVCTIFSKRPQIRIIVILLVLAISSRAGAEIYKFVDGKGTAHYSNVPTDPRYKMILIPEDRKARGVRHLGSLIEKKSRIYGVDPAMVKAVIAVESDFNPLALSKKGAGGLMQLMPETADELGVSNIFDPEDNIDGGIRYLRYLLDYFNWDIDLALAAYNAGITRVVKYGGIPPFPQTRSYVRKVKNTYGSYTPMQY